MSIKIERINSEIVKNISEILANETRDKLMQTITITAADTSKDLSFAKIYFTSMEDLSKDQLEKEMNEASDFVRKKLAEKMDLRQTPKLKFIFDVSIEYGNKIEKILEEIHNQEKAQKNLCFFCFLGYTPSQFQKFGIKIILKGEIFNEFRRV